MSIPEIDVTVVIPNYNGKELLTVCLQSLRKQTFPRFQVIVVDNGSTDGSVSCIREAFPEVDVLALQKNMGFAAAVNRGIGATHTSFIALINNDAKLAPTWIELLVDYMHHHKEVAAVCGKMLRLDEPGILDSVGDVVNSVGQASGRGSGQLDTGQFDHTEEIFSVCGGASVWRRTVFEHVGLFDERFFAFFEDVDMGFRLRKLGFTCVYIPSAVCWHKRSATALRNPGRMMYLHYRNTWIVIFKHFPATSFLRRGRWWKLPIVYMRTFKHLVTLGFIKEALMVQINWPCILPSIMYDRWRDRNVRTSSFREMERWFTEKEVRFPWTKPVLSS